MQVRPNLLEWRRAMSNGARGKVFLECEVYESKLPCLTFLYQNRRVLR